MPDLEAIRARLDATSPGPWFDTSYGRVCSAPLVEIEDRPDTPQYPEVERPARLWSRTDGAEGAPHGSPEDDAWLAQRDAAYDVDPVICDVPTLYGDTARRRHYADMVFIAEAREDVTALLAEVERQAARIEELEREGHRLMDLVFKATDVRDAEMQRLHNLIGQKDERIAELERGCRCCRGSQTLEVDDVEDPPSSAGSCLICGQSGYHAHPVTGER